MKSIHSEIETILAGKPVKRRKCPYYGKPLEIFINGLSTEEIEVFMQKNPGYFTYGGCCVFGDDRDPVYYCSGCSRELSYDLKVLDLICCPLVSNEIIHKEECRQYRVLAGKNRYTLSRYRELVCDKICPSIDKEARVVANDGIITEGKIKRVKLATPDSPGSFLLVGINREDGCGDTVSIRITDINTVEAI